MTIDYGKIVTNAISALVCAVFLGAMAIVWRGATTVDEKVQRNRQDLEHLVDQLSDKLASYQVQLTSISNQLHELRKEPSRSPAQAPVHALEDAEQRALRQGAIRTDIYNQLKK
jgi:uncharacterized protein YlxW (UPF0749 family)